MFVKKGTELKLKTNAELSFDKSLLLNGNAFFKGSKRLTKQMLITTKKIIIPVDCELKNGFLFNGYYWYDWMFNLSDLKNAIFLKTE